MNMLRVGTWISILLFFSPVQAMYEAICTETDILCDYGEYARCFHKRTPGIKLNSMRKHWY